ncbi:hypothetical protein B566_EDAN019032, partial [Ephemera danica]
MIIRRPAHPADQLPGPPTVPFFGNALMFAKPSIGAKWHSRRKLLTPAFHFSILEQFVPVFCDKTRVLVEKLKSAASVNPDGFDIVPYVTMCALDIICQTAMGYSLDVQEGKNQTYVSAVTEMGELVYYRNKRPWLFPNWTFYWTHAGRQYKRCLKTLHAFTDMVIQKRREERKGNKTENYEENEEKDNIGRKKRIAFLDLLLKCSDEDPTFDDKEMRAEVDTFMFAGHDTTGMLLSFILHYLSAYPEIQSRCVEELDDIFCGSDRDLNISDLGNMKYLERVIKETLRLQPPAWFVGRRLEKNMKFDGYDAFPANTVIHVNIFSIHRNPEIYPDPEKFDPDRFLPENCVGRHPYA